MSWTLACFSSGGAGTRSVTRNAHGGDCYWLAFAAAYPDADLAHRLALAPGMLVIALDGIVAEHDPAVPRWIRAAAIPVIVLSAAQIVRSAVLYLARG